ncbi:MAG: hypothetical protein JNJ90_09715 [Saprospiraceae bacterium]|nr:hypothetical protein [Saprospiraceae bacterium]
MYVRPMFEHRSQPLLPRHKFASRVLRYGAVASAILAVSLLFGMAGYRYFAGIGWTDAFYNASMILTGMGPGLDIDHLSQERQDPVRIFAGLYALYSGVVFLVASGLMLSPLLHRFFHIMHLDIKD